MIASNGAAGALERCLLALEPQIGAAEVLVCAPHENPAETQRRFPFARFVEHPDALAAELWRDGIDASGGDIVALTISPMEPAPDWIETIRAQHRSLDVVGGAIEPGSELRLVDWAEYFCRYARDMRPFAAHDCLDLPGDNASYKRALLERVRESYRDGFWEPVLHRRLREQGVKLWHDPALVVRLGRSAGFAVFLRQRLAHGRVFGRQRGAGLSAAQNGLRAAAAPLVAVVLPLRAAREVFAKRRHRTRFLLSLPLLLAFDAAWALGECRGHLEARRAV